MSTLGSCHTTCNVCGRNLIDICRVTKDGHIEHCKVGQKLGSVSPSVELLPFGVTIPATVPQRTEIPGGTYELPCTILLVTR